MSNDPRWAHYLAERGKDGAYTGVDPVELDTILDDVIEVIADDDRVALEDIVGHEYNLTPVEIASMSVAELKNWAGIEDDDTRQLLLDNVNDWFNHRFTAQELAELSNEELQKLLDMSDVEAETFVDGIWDRNHVFDAADEAQANPRVELEEDVYAEYDDLTRPEIAKMSDRELELLMEAAANYRKVKWPAVNPTEVR